MIKTLTVILLLELIVIPVAVLGYRNELHALVAFKAWDHIHAPKLILPVIKSEEFATFPITIVSRRMHYPEIKPHPSEEKPWVCETKQLEQGEGEVIVCEPQE